MPTTQAQIDIINQALSLLGVEPVVDLLDLDSPAAVQANLHWGPALDVLGRSAKWSCLMKPQKLEPVAQDPLDPTVAAPVSIPWVPGHLFLAGDYCTFGNPAYYYQALIQALSSASFTNDLTAGLWMQTDIFNPDPFSQSGQNFASGWAYKYNLPEDCLLVASYNDLTEFDEVCQIMGASLYSNDACAIIKFTWPDPDTTRYDAMFVECLQFKLAAKMATKLRQDDTNVAQQMEGQYLRKLSAARAKNGNEVRGRRFNPVANSRWVGSRLWSTNS